MNIITVTGLVIKTTPYKEKDKLVTLFTLEQGKILVSARGVMNIKSKLAPSCLVHTLGNFEINEKNGYYTLTGCNIIDTFHDLSYDIDKFYTAEILAEMTDRHLREGQEFESFFLKLMNFYKILVYEKTQSKVLLLKFLLEIIAENGIELDYRPICAICGKSLTKLRFSYNKFCFVCDECIEPIEKTSLLSEDNRDLLCTIGYLTLDSLDGITVNNALFKDVMRGLYIILHNVLGFSCTALVEYMKLV